MPLRSGWLAQLNWSLFGPLIIVLALVVGLSGFIISLTDAGERGGAPAMARRAPATGGGTALEAPEAVRSQLFSLSARVSGTPTIRRGPGTQYPAVATLQDGEEVHVIACSPGCEWLRVFSLNDEEQRWVPGVFLSVSGRLDELPVLVPSNAGER